MIDRPTAGRCVVVGDALLDRDVLGAGGPARARRARPRRGRRARPASGPAAPGSPRCCSPPRRRDVTLRHRARADDAAGASLRSLLADAGVGHLRPRPDARDAGEDPGPRRRAVAGPPRRAARPARAGRRRRRRRARGGDAETPTRCSSPTTAAASRRTRLRERLAAGRRAGRSSGTRTRAAPTRCPAARRDPEPARGRWPSPPDDAATSTRRGRARCAERWQARGVAATDGAAGAVTLLAESPPLLTPAPHASTGDPCGAGDRFAGTAGPRARPRRRHHRGRRRGACSTSPPRWTRAASAALDAPAPDATAARAGRRRRRARPRRAAARSSPPAAASTCCTPATSRASRRPARARRLPRRLPELRRLRQPAQGRRTGP